MLVRNKVSSIHLTQAECTIGVNSAVRDTGNSLDKGHA